MTLTRRALVGLGWVVGSLVVLAFGVGLVLQWQDEQADRDFANWCSAQGGRSTFSTEPSGWTDPGSGRCFEYGTNRLIVTEAQWKANRG